MQIHPSLVQIAEDVLAGKQRRAKVRTLMGYFSLKKRKSAGLQLTRNCLTELGITTIPEFEIAEFDSQVLFVPLGTEIPSPSQSTPSEESDQIYSVETVKSNDQRTQLRILLKTYDTQERLLTSIVKGRRANVTDQGQNARRQDRDQFPFFVTIDIANVDQDKVEEWVESAASLEVTDEPIVTPTEFTPSVYVPVPESDSKLREHIADLHEAMKAELAKQIHEVQITVEKKVEEIRLDSIRQLASELGDERGLQMLSEFEAEYWSKLSDSNQKNKELEEQNFLLLAQIEELEDQQAEQEKYDPSDAYPTVCATLQLFSNICKNDPISVLPAAQKSASRCASQKRLEILKFLLALRDYAILKFNDTAQSVPPVTYFKSRGYDYAAKDSETTTNKHGHEREITIDNQKIQMREHVTLFPNSPNCISVYWTNHPSKNELVIGYLGNHLSITSR